MSEEVHPNFPLGCDVYVREPKRFGDARQSMTGAIQAFELIEGHYIYWLTVSVVDKLGDGKFLCSIEKICLPEWDIGERGGTPINQLSGRPGHPGFERFCEIASSWGYE
jgi:hypothetical protein